MRGRASVGVRKGLLEAAQVAHIVPGRRCYDFSAFTDEELEELASLAEWVEEDEGKPIWTAAELAMLQRLEPKLATVGRVR